MKRYISELLKSTNVRLYLTICRRLEKSFWQKCSGYIHVNKCQLSELDR